MDKPCKLIISHNVKMSKKITPITNNKTFAESSPMHIGSKISI